MKKVFNSIKGVGIFLGLTFIFTLPLFPAQQIDFSQKPLQWERSRTFDAQHYLIKINLNIEQKSFSGETTIILSSLKDNLKRIELDAEDFKVERVINKWGQPLSFEQKEKKLTIDLDRSYGFGETLALTIFYQSDPQAHQTAEKKKGLRFYQATSEHPALVASDSWPDGVHHWFPCYDFPNDKVTDEIIATVKEPNKVVSNGRLLKVVRNPGEGTVSYHWLQNKPHSTYLIFLAAAPYRVLRDRYQNIPINYWVFPQHVQDALRSYQKTPQMMEFFIKTFGTPYPWAKYDQVSVPFGGGAESTSATAMTYRIIHDEKAEKDFSSIGIVSHELAHQWWGDLITLRSWEHAWLNESFATYCDYLYWNYDRGPEEGAVNLLNKKNSYLQEAKNEYIRPIVTNHYHAPQDLFDAHSYPKGACVLHMLRFILGDKAFFRVWKE
ncbi:MAG: M1 family metallopeptidase, partial [Candidatus Aminicenantales bacterium]